MQNVANNISLLSRVHYTYKENRSFTIIIFVHGCGYEKTHQKSKYNTPIIVVHSIAKGFFTMPYRASLEMLDGISGVDLHVPLMYSTIIRPHIFRKLFYCQ